MHNLACTETVFPELISDMKILKIIHGYPPVYNAGSEVYSQSMCSELSKSHQVEVVTREENPYLPDFSVRKIGIHENLHLNFINKRFDKDQYNNKNIDYRFSKIIERFQPDIAHIGHLNHLSLGIIPVLKKNSIPIVFTLHDFWLMCPRGQFLQRNYGNKEFFQLCSSQENRKCAENCYNMYFSDSEYCEEDAAYWEKWIEKRMDETRRVSSLTDLFIAPSRYLRERFIREFDIPEHKIIYLDYGFPNEYLKPAAYMQTEKFTFGYIGTHIPSKGVNLLIEAFIKLYAEFRKDCRLIIFGRHQGQNTDYLRRVSSGYPIEFRNEYMNEEIAEKVFSETDCIVVPSVWGENSPLVIHEAQACRIPVITADYGGMKEYVNEGVNGLLFQHRDSDDLCKKMKEAAANPIKMKELGQRGYLYSENGDVPDIGEHCRQLVKIYASLIQKKT